LKRILERENATLVDGDVAEKTAAWKVASEKGI
jgi:hypothetical protein